ncbi:tyrosine-type recombinase/integrase [Dactylosporangium sp. CA-092794]|uniref:tyrosine-type recombinase/integrase n=1 Tax=Dactylosporangium sp. CA-092794 TaxID=3239929 RepID=UPI003D8A39FF
MGDDLFGIDRDPWHPDQIINRFEHLIQQSHLSPIRVHDLRHCAATYLKAAGADMKDIQETLGPRRPRPPA